MTLFLFTYRKDLLKIPITLYSIVFPRVNTEGAFLSIIWRFISCQRFVMNLILKKVMDRWKINK